MYDSGKNQTKEEDDDAVSPHPTKFLTKSDKKCSSIDLELGPPLHPEQAEEYKKIQQVIDSKKKKKLHHIHAIDYSFDALCFIYNVICLVKNCCHVIFFQILIRMNKLCTQTQNGGFVKPRKHEQRLLRNVGVHTVVLDLLQIPYDEKEDTRMNELMRLAHEFLQNFCLGNQQNQVLLHKHLDLFLNPGVSIKEAF